MSTLYLKCCVCGLTMSIEDGDVPGECGCGTRHPYPWKVRRDPWPAESRGYVVVHSHLGAQELTGPRWREHPDKWEATGVVHKRIKERK